MVTFLDGFCKMKAKKCEVLQNSYCVYHNDGNNTKFLCDFCKKEKTETFCIHCGDILNETNMTESSLGFLGNMIYNECKSCEKEMNDLYLSSQDFVK